MFVLICILFMLLIISLRYRKKIKDEQDFVNAVENEIQIITRQNDRLNEMIKELDREMLARRKPVPRDMHSNILKALSRPPKDYPLEGLADSLRQQNLYYVIPSYGYNNDEVESKVFRKVFALYEKARFMEKQKLEREALNIYLHILFNCFPGGGAYYLRPAIILERMKQYDAALAVWMLYKSSLAFENYPRGSQPYIEWEHRNNRLLSKLAKQEQLYSSHLASLEK